jgi:hypothetical protein
MLKFGKGLEYNFTLYISNSNMWFKDICSKASNISTPWGTAWNKRILEKLHLSRRPAVRFSQDSLRGPEWSWRRVQIWRRGYPLRRITGRTRQWERTAEGLSPIVKPAVPVGQEAFLKWTWSAENEHCPRVGQKSKLKERKASLN